MARSVRSPPGLLVSRGIITLLAAQMALFVGVLVAPAFNRRIDLAGSMR